MKQALFCFAFIMQVQPTVVFAQSGGYTPPPLSDAAGRSLGSGLISAFGVSSEGGGPAQCDIVRSATVQNALGAIDRSTELFSALEAQPDSAERRACLDSLRILRTRGRLLGSETNPPECNVTGAGGGSGSGSGRGGSANSDSDYGSGGSRRVSSDPDPLAEIRTRMSSRDGVAEAVRRLQNDDSEAYNDQVYADTQAAIAQLEPEYNRRLAEYNMQIDELRRQKDLIEQQISATDRTFSQSANEYTDIMRAIAAAEAALSALVASRTSAIADADRSNALALSIQNELLASINAIRSELRDLLGTRAPGSLTGAATYIDIFGPDTAAIDEQITAARATLNELRNELEELNALPAAAREEVRRQWEATQELARQSAELDSRILILNQELRLLQEIEGGRLSALRAQLSRLDPNSAAGIACRAARTRMAEARRAEAFNVVSNYSEDLTTSISTCANVPGIGTELLAPLINSGVSLATGMMDLGGMAGAAVNLAGNIFQSIISAFETLFRQPSANERAIQSLMDAQLPIGLRCGLESLQSQYCEAQSDLQARLGMMAEVATHNAAIEEALRGVDTRAGCFNGIDFTGFSMLSGRVEREQRWIDELQSLLNDSDAETLIRHMEEAGPRGTLAQRYDRLANYIAHVRAQLLDRISELTEARRPGEASALSLRLSDLSVIGDRLTGLSATVTRYEYGIGPLPIRSAYATSAEYERALIERSRRVSETPARLRADVAAMGTINLRNDLMMVLRTQLDLTRVEFSEIPEARARLQAVGYLRYREAELTSAELEVAATDAAVPTPATSGESIDGAAAGTTVMEGTLDTMARRLADPMSRALSEARTRFLANGGELEGEDRGDAFSVDDSTASGIALEGLCRAALTMPDPIPSGVRAACSGLRPYHYQRCPGTAAAAELGHPTYGEWFDRTLSERRCLAQRYLRDHSTRIMSHMARDRADAETMCRGRPSSGRRTRTGTR